LVLPLLMQSCGSVEVSHGKIRVRLQRRIAEQKGWWNYSYLKDFLFLY